MVNTPVSKAASSLILVTSSTLANTTEARHARLCTRIISPSRCDTRGAPAHDNGKGDDIAGKVFVGNLNFSTTQAELEALFGSVGEVTEVILPVDRATGRPRGFAFVKFSDASAIPAAISRLDGTELGGRTLKVNEAQERPPRPPGGGGRDFANGPPFQPDPGDRVPFRPDVDGGSRFRADSDDPPNRPGKPKGSRRGIRGRKRGF